MDAQHQEHRVTPAKAGISGSGARDASLRWHDEEGGCSRGGAAMLSANPPPSPPRHPGHDPGFGFAPNGSKKSRTPCQAQGDGERKPKKTIFLHEPFWLYELPF